MWHKVTSCSVSIATRKHSGIQNYGLQIPFTVGSEENPVEV